MNIPYKIGDSKIHGKGLIAVKNLKPDDLIGLSHINNEATPEVGRYHNHSDRPNAVNVKIDNERYLIAESPIKEGDEITVDYRKQPDLEQPEDFMKEGGMTPQTDGYRTHSPFKHLPYIDIESDTIDSDNIVYDLKLVSDNGITKNVKKNTGLHKIPGAKVIKEIPIAQEGGELKDEMIADMLENGAFLPKFKTGSEMNIKGRSNIYKIKKEYDEKYRLPYIQYNIEQGDTENNRVYYDKDDEDGEDNFNIIDIQSREIQKEKTHNRLKSILIKYNNKETLSPIEMEYITELGLTDTE